jgi:hypothetical protein
MKNSLFLLISLMSAVASAAKNPFPVKASCNLVLYDVAGGTTVASDSKEVVLPAFHMSPSADLLLSGTRNGKTYNFSGHAVRNNGTERVSITLSKFVGDAKVLIGAASADTDTRLEPGDSANAIYYILEANKQIGYFACGMYVWSAE